MLNHATATSAQVALPDRLPADAHERGAEAALISFADPAPEGRIVVHGGKTLELQCALLRRGCTSVFAIRQGAWPLTDTMDLVLLTAIERRDGLDHAIAQAHRVLAPLGTLALHVGSPADSPPVRQVGRLLALHGFEAIRFLAVPGGTLCRAELPWHGRMARA